jgi:hypothetical protein
VRIHGAGTFDWIGSENRMGRHQRRSSPQAIEQHADDHDGAEHDICA